jgi:tRNA A-37 threonylcarbamoyl transferase component Bud32
MVESTCPREALLWPLAAGEAGDPLIEEHLENCDSCRDRYQQLVAEVDALREAAERLPPRPLDNGHADSPKERNGRAASSPLPATIGRYRVIDLLDEGGQAAVYRAIHPELRREVVIKLGKRPVADADAEDRLAQEARLLADLDHPHLARVRDLDVHEGKPFLVLDYIRGMSLAHYGAGRKLTPCEIANLLAKIARAVGVVNDQGILHKDLKPRNVMIDEAGQPRVIDFGMAQVRDAWSRDPEDSEYVEGTPAFMAPEQARGEVEKIGPASDVFALGGILYALLTGRAPFADEDTHESLQRAALGAYDGSLLRQRHIPRRLAAICRKAMNAEPADRYATAGELAAALESFIAWPRRVGWTTGIAAAAATALLAIWLANRPDPIPPEFKAFVVKDSVEGQLIERQLANFVPIKNGNRLRISGIAPSDFHVAMFLRTADGQLQQFQHEERTDDQGAKAVGFPRPGEVAPFDGAPGTNVLLICAREGKPITIEEVEACFDRVPQWKEFPPRSSSVQFDRELAQITGSKAVSVRAAPEAPLLEQAETLREALLPRFDYFHGVVFAHVE